MSWIMLRQGRIDRTHYLVGLEYVLDNIKTRQDRSYTLPCRIVYSMSWIMLRQGRIDPTHYLVGLEYVLYND